jgi:hypothetical protein
VSRLVIASAIEAFETDCSMRLASSGHVGRSCGFNFGSNTLLLARDHFTADRLHSDTSQMSLSQLRQFLCILALADAG